MVKFKKKPLSLSFNDYIGLVKFFWKKGDTLPLLD